MATVSEILAEAERKAPGSVKPAARIGWMVINPPLKVLERRSHKEFHITGIDVDESRRGTIRVKGGGFRLAEDFAPLPEWWEKEKS